MTRATDRIVSIIDDAYDAGEYRDNAAVNRATADALAVVSELEVKILRLTARVVQLSGGVHRCPECGRMLEYRVRGTSVTPMRCRRHGPPEMAPCSGWEPKP